MRSRRFARVAQVVAAIGLAVFMASNRTVIVTALTGFTRMALLPAFVGVGLSVAAMLNRGQLNRAAHQAVGLAVEPFAITRTATVSFAANKVVRSAGAAGLAVFVRDGRRQGLASGAVAASCVLAAAASFAALGVLLASTVVILAMAGRLSGWWIAAAGGFGLYSVIVLAAGFVAVRSRPLALRLWRRGQRARARIGRRQPTFTGASAADELFDALAVARGRAHWTRRVVSHSIASKALGALMLVAATHAAGVHMSVAGATVVYATALAASMVSIVPGGVGVVEASTGAMLVSAGASVPAAALAVALFRIFDLWLPVAAGAFLGRNDFRAPRIDAGPSVVLLPDSSPIDQPGSNAVISAISAC